MYPVVVEINSDEDVLISQEGSPAIRLSVEQIPFIIELLHQAKSKVEDMRYRRLGD
jgi:hypothetical protein